MSNGRCAFSAPEFCDEKNLSTRLCTSTNHVEGVILTMQLGPLWTEPQKLDR